MGWLFVSALAACTSETPNPADGGNAAENVQKLVINLSDSGDRLTTRAGRPLHSSEPGQWVQHVTLYVTNEQGIVLQKEIDEHVWTSPRNEIVIIRNLSELMAGLNPAMADDYRSNASSYISKIEELDTAFRSIVQTGKRHTLIFASRFPLLYFVREYGLEYYAAFPGCAEESEPSARTVAFLIDKARELEVPCILNIELSSQMIADVIAEEAGCDVMVFNTLHNVTASDFYSGKNYVDLMGENIGVLREALN